MPVARPEPSDARIIAHVDMDCFYAQVEQRKRPELRGLPTAVVQYNSWKGGGLIAVSYEARKYGVKRSMRGDEAKDVCPQINLVQVPVARGKADLNIYRNAGSEVVSILARRGRCERASIDEVYLDLTDAAETMLSENPPEILEAIDEEALKSHVLGLSEDGNDNQENVRKWLCRNDADHRDKLLACGAIIVAELRMQVFKETEFTCSAGIAHNKMLAKLASPMNKPAQQTVVPFAAVKGLLASLPVKKMKQLGGKLGSALQSDLGVNTVGDLLQFSEEKLQEHYGINTGTWLWNIARGISGDEVQGRLLPKSHGCGKNFTGPQALKTIASVERWLNDLCEELSERIQSDLDKNKRVAHTLTLHARAYKTNDSDSQKKFPSKSCPLRYGTAKIQEDALKLFESALREFLGSNRFETQGNQNNGWGITSLSISASKILATPSGTCSILRFFHGPEPSCSSPNHITSETTQGTASLSSSGRESFPALDRAELPKLTLEETTNKCQNSSSDRDEQITEKSNYKGTCSISRFFRSCEQACTGIIQDAVPSGLENSLGLNQADSKKKCSRTETGINCARSSIDREEHKREAWNEKGTSSILKFFHGRSPSCSSSQQLCNRMIDDTAPLSPSGSENCTGWDHVRTEGSLRIDCKIESARPSLDRDKQRRETWDNFKIEEIDPSVIDELPPEIQDEVRGWLRPLKHAKTAKKGSSIAHYFLPAKKT
ncbi:DNA-repair protein [Macleaya cordata]|uniref:DNA polymerase eta n=1 Tax=Macleaya cordata TaxID=56857 RepID=A0A200QZ43_MACCD|nr:DNA-repair protein [Macleaya cordata]